MEPWVVVLIVVLGGILFFIAQHFGWIDLSDKSKASGRGSGGMGIGDEVFHPTRHEAQIELNRQAILPAPAPLPGDGDLGIGAAGQYDGQVSIDLTKPDSKPSRGKHSAGEQPPR